MSKNTSVALGNYFEEFVQNQVSTGRFKNVSEVIRAGLRLLENEESKLSLLKHAINEGLESPKIDGFDFDEYLLKLKSDRIKKGEV